ncbi:MAG TPA: LUD domain-containing protein [Caulobacteraceae bacterium]|jgi:L-lactate dehydrogenase complex protein LldG
MTCARDSILEAVRRNRPRGEYPPISPPRFSLPEPQGRQAKFIGSLKLMGGTVLEASTEQTLLETLEERLKQAGHVCSAVPEIVGDRNLAAVKSPAELADVDVAVVRAILGVAETGSVLFTERELRINTVAYLAQHLVVLLDPTEIVDGLQAAYDHPVFKTAAYAVFHTGPSATGDIEGVLIHGAQGVRSLTVVFQPRPAVG